MLEVCDAYLSLPFMRGIATLGVGVGMVEGEERLDTARPKICFYAADSKVYYHTVIISS